MPNDFVYFFLKFPILIMFKNKHEKPINQLPPIIAPKALDNNMYVVFNYLKVLKEGHLADKDLYINKVSLDA